MLILVILIATVFFFHGLLRLVIMIFKRKRVASGRTSLPETQIYGPRGYAVPNRPIQVVLARDEEAAGVESEAGKSKPPAYGLWRESVVSHEIEPFPGNRANTKPQRVDPNRLFWQRNEAVDEAQLRPTTRSGPRPPSYASDDGVSYVVEAAPRSTAPTVDVPLPTHPSEMGRVARMPRS